MNRSAWSGRSFPGISPILMAVWKLAPALAAGNCVVLKPAEQTPMSIMVLAELIADLLPDRRTQHRQRVRDRGRQAARQQASRIAKIAFTGETTTGRLIMQYASRESDPGARLELGGKSPEYLLCRRHGRRRRLFSTRCSKGFVDVRAQSRRGLHLPEPRLGS